MGILRKFAQALHSEISATKFQRANEIRVINMTSVLGIVLVGVQSVNQPTNEKKKIQLVRKTQNNTPDFFGIDFSFRMVCTAAANCV